MIKQFIAYLKHTPSAKQLAQRELEDAERELLKEQTLLDYSANIVNYQQDRIKRLKQVLGHNQVHAP